MDATVRLAEFAFALGPGDIPQRSVEMVTALAIDTIGCALPAWNAPGVAQLRCLQSAWSKGTSRVWVTGERMSPAAATLVNSAMAHALEYDDLHSELPIHCGCVTIPAALAVAETNPSISGAELVAAIVGGTEILCRLARANRSYRASGFRGFNPTSIIAGFAAAAVAGRLLGLSASGIAHAMGLSYSQASGNQQCIEDGGLAKRMQPGMVAEAGVRAAWLARAGVTGAIDAIEGTNGYFNIYESGEYDPEFLTKDLGVVFELDAIAFKRYPICGMAHPAVDALRELRDLHRFAVSDVSNVRVFGSKFVVDMVGRPYRPGQNPEVDAQFSVRYCVATVLLTGNVTLTDLKAENTLAIERIRLAQTIAVEEDRNLKGKWSTRVEVELHNGTKLTRGRENAAGQSDRRLSIAELVNKFIDCAAVAGNLHTSDHARRLCETLVDLPQLSTVAVLCDLLATWPALSPELEKTAHANPA